MFEAKTNRYVVGEWLQPIGSSEKPLVKLHVLGLLIEKCYGGIQIHYDCRAYFIATHDLVSWGKIGEEEKKKSWVPEKDKRRFLEIELEPYTGGK